MGVSVPGLGSGAGEWATVRLGRRRLPLSTRQRANGRPGETSMCTCTSTCTDISPLACTTNNAAEVSALRDIQILFSYRYARAGGSEIGQAEGGLRAGAVSPMLRVRLPP